MQLSTLQDLYGHTGPFVTVHVDVSRNTADLAEQIESRWTNVRHRLEHEGVEGDLVEEIGERMRQPVALAGEVRRTIVTAGDRVVLDDLAAGHSDWPEGVSTGDLPDLAGWVHLVDGQPSFLLAVIDHEGADIDYYPSLATAEAVHAQVSGEADELQKVRGGGWAHKRYQRRSDNQAEDNARDVAEEVRSLAARTRPRAVLLAGEARARAEVLGSLGGVQSEVVELESGGRAAGSSTESLWDDVRATLARVELEDSQQVLDRLDERRGQGSGAAAGLDDVLQALTQHKVETLVVDLRTLAEATVDPKRYTGLPVPEQVRDGSRQRADQVLLAAGAATDAELVAVEDGRFAGGDGVAALLRWDD